MKVAVTGSNGLVGTALQRVALDKPHTSFHFLTREDADLCDLNATEDMLRRIRPDTLIHLAGWVRGIGGHQKSQWEGFELNTVMNTNIIRAARLAGVKNIIAMGTGAVYSHNTPCPLREDALFTDQPHGSEGGYAEAKRHMVRHLMLSSDSQFKWSYIVSANIFGPNDFFNEEQGHVIPSLISKFENASSNNDKVTVWGDGSAVRDFVYSLDMARVILQLIDQPRGVINVGSGQALSILQIVELLNDIFDYNQWGFDPSKPNGAAMRSYDLLKMQELKPTITPVREALEKTVLWYQENKSSARH